MKFFRNKLRARLAGLALAGALLGTGAATVTTITEQPTTAAQAFSTFSYYANCPGDALYQQLVVQHNNSGYTIRVEGFDIGWGEVRFIAAGTTIYYFPIQYMDSQGYQFQGIGTLDWYYHVSCYY